MVTIMITCDTLVYKIIDFYGFKLTASGIIFSMCYLISTITTEVYGYKKGVRIIWIMLLCQTFYVVAINSAAIVQRHNNEVAGHYHELFHEFWRVMVGTWISVPASYFCNSFVISKLKIFFLGRLFIIRYMVSAMTAQAVLLITAYPISLSGKYSFGELLNILASTWSYKVLISFILFPIGIYLVGVVKKYEKTDFYDWGISYNPLKAFSEDKKLN